MLYHVLLCKECFSACMGSSTLSPLYTLVTEVCMLVEGAKAEVYTVVITF
jgi:hypothetical protein